jgi:hypothetical protein
MQCEWLKGKRRRGSKEFDRFERWLSATASLCAELWAYTDEFFPFHDNESSAVSVLVGGAARAGFLPVSEYRLRKRAWEDRRRWRDGRADLWFVADNSAYSFEFKRSWNAANQKNLQSVLELARSDIRRVPTTEYDTAFAGVIAPVYDEAEPGVYNRYVEEVDYACRLGDPDTFEVFLYFDECKR